MINKFSLTDEQCNSVINSKPYQRWKANAESSEDWRYWCYKTLYPNEGVEIPEIYLLYVYVYLECDTEDNVRPMARAIEFTLWLIETQYSGVDSATARLLKGYAKGHLALIEDIANEYFKDSKVYAPVMRFISHHKGDINEGGARVVEQEKKVLESQTDDKIWEDKKSKLPDILKCHIDDICKELEENGFCKRNGDKYEWLELARDYAYFIYRANLVFNKKRFKHRFCVKPLDNLFSHEWFKLQHIYDVLNDMKSVGTYNSSRSKEINLIFSRIFYSHK